MCAIPTRTKADAAPGAENDRMPWPVRQQRHVRVGQLAFVDFNRPAWANDLVNPGLERRGHAEVVERRTDDQYIGGDQLIDQLVAFGQRVPHPRLTAFFWRKAGGDPVMADKRRRVLANIPINDAVLRAAGRPLADEAVGEVTAVGTVLVLAGKAGAGAGIEVQKVRHDDSPL